MPKSDQKAIEERLAVHGHEGFAAAWLRRKGLDSAADMLTPKRLRAGAADSSGEKTLRQVKSVHAA